MKQLLVKKGVVRPHEVPEPPCNANSLLVKTHYSFISTGTEGATISSSGQSFLKKCTTNAHEKIEKVKSALKDNGVAGTLALIKGTLDKVMELGYSCSGEVTFVGKNVTNFKVGDFVACAGSGIAHHAEYVVVPKHLAVKVNDKKFLKQTSLTTIGAIALQGIRRADLKLGETVCVIGLGLIGQLTVQLAKNSGCTVIGIDIDETKLKLAKKIGCDKTFHALESDVKKELEFATHHHGVDATIITAASNSGTIIQQAMEVTRRKGKVVLVGDVKLDFDRSPFYQKEIDFLISCSYGPGRYDSSYENSGIDYPYSYVRWTENRNMQLFADLIQKKQIDIDSLISHEFSVHKSEAAYAHVKKRTCLGVVLGYDMCAKEKSENTSSNSVKNINSSCAHPECFAKHGTCEAKCIEGSRTQNKQTNIAMIGAGGFAKVKLLPLISKIKNTKITTIIDTNSANAINIANQYHAQNFDNNYKKVLNSKEVNTVVIATPHAMHAQQTLDVLRAHKAVFVEKPAATTFEQLHELKDYFSKNPTAHYCVDFNRSFAPFMLKIKQAVKKRTTPLIIHYRMNAGYIPVDHWIQSKTHGGRIIGEACHIFELFSFLTNSKPINISVHPINAQSADILSSDNFNATITYGDGSVCSLLYTAIGNTKEQEKERMEVFFDGKSIVINDFKELNGFGLPKSFSETTKSPDKGHHNLLTQFMHAVQTGTPSPLSVERILLATEISLIIDDMCRSNPSRQFLNQNTIQKSLRTSGESDTAIHNKKI